MNQIVKNLSENFFFKQLIIFLQNSRIYLNRVFPSQNIWLNVYGVLIVFGIWIFAWVSFRKGGQFNKFFLIYSTTFVIPEVAINFIILNGIQWFLLYFWNTREKSKKVAYTYSMLKIYNFWVI